MTRLPARKGRGEPTGNGAKRRRRRPAVEIRRRLLDAAREEFKARGYAHATTAAIARQADVAEIQMFRYFSSKAELFREAVFTPLRDHFRAFNAKHGPEARDEASIRERTHLYLSELLAFLDEHSKMLVSLFVAQTYEAATPPASPAEDGLQGYLNEIVAAMSERTGPSAIDPRTMGRIAFAAVLGCITYKDWLFPKGSASGAEIADALTEFTLAGIGPLSDAGSAGRG